MSLLDVATKSAHNNKRAWWKRITPKQLAELTEAVDLIQSGKRPDLTWAAMVESIESEFGVEINETALRRFRQSLRSRAKGKA